MIFDQNYIIFKDIWKTHMISPIGLIFGQIGYWRGPCRMVQESCNKTVDFVFLI